MKILYFMRNDLHLYPPCYSQILFLNDLDVEVIVCFSGCDESIKKILRKRSIEYIDFKIKRNKNPIIGKIQSFINYKRAVINILQERYEKGDILWFGTADSAFVVGKRLDSYQYVLSVLELYDNNKFYKNQIEKIIHNAKAVIACEDTRAFIMKSWWKLKNKPFVLPNKPYFHPKSRKLEGSVEQTRSMIKRIKGKKTILYQGIISVDRDLSVLASALNIMNEDIYLVLMGKEFYNGAEKIRRIYKKTIYLEYVPAPLHLEITSHAMIGVANYDDSCLNNLFCAPNKIYEYSGFGLPILGSNVPGLKNTIEYFQAGICVDFNDVHCIECAVKKLILEYDLFSENSLKFYDASNNYEIMDRILKFIMH